MSANKKISLKTQNESSAQDISKKYSLHLITSRVLAARGFSPGEELDHFLNPTLKSGLPEPQKLLGINQAIELISETLKNKGKIAICCDFDVDGLSGGAQLLDFFESIGAKAEVFVPDRFSDGYGLNERQIKEIAEQKFSLLITVDFGTTNKDELTRAKELGLNTIVIDHHHVGDHKPPCDVFINPKQKNCGFAGEILSASGLVWYVICALRKNLAEAKDVDPKRFLDLASLGTICDMVPLIGANRVIAKRGLELLSDDAAPCARPGIIALKQVAGINKNVECYDIGFIIGPRLNAAGRLQHGSLVIELLTTKDSEKAQKLAKKLDKLNSERQAIEAEVKDLAIKKVKAHTEIPKVIVVWDKSFHTGVVGIVAQRLVEIFHRPAVVLGVDKEGIYKGSVRGVKGFSVVEALSAVSEHLLKFGGHEAAGGLSLKEVNLETFAAAINNLPELDFSPPEVFADTEVNFAELDLVLSKELKNLAPFGIGNATPQFLCRDLKIINTKILKDAHLKITLANEKIFFSAFLWRQKSHACIKEGNKINAIFKLNTNTFGGLTELQLNLQAVELSAQN